MSRHGRLLLLLLAWGCAACAPRPRLRPFASDGCTWFPDGTSRREQSRHACCVEHDSAYWQGGTKAERLQADLALGDCVERVGHPGAAKWMLRGARAGGTPYLPTYFRWGFGWRYYRGYRPLSREERELVEFSERR